MAIKSNVKIRQISLIFSVVIDSMTVYICQSVEFTNKLKKILEFSLSRKRAYMIKKQKVSACIIGNKEARSAGIWPDVDPNMRLTLIDDVRYAYIKHSHSAQRMDSGLGGSMLPVFLCGTDASSRNDCDSLCSRCLYVCGYSNVCVGD